MTQYRPGILVEHPTQPWGPGKVLHVEGDKVKVHFRDDPEKLEYRTISIKHVALKPTLKQSDMILDNLPPFDGQRFRVDAPRVTVEDGIERFVRKFPLAFADPAYIGTGKLAGDEYGERAYKLNACQRYRELLGGDTLGSLLARGDIAELTQRACLTVTRELNLLSPYENMAFRDGLHADPESAQRFFSALRDFVDSPGVDERAYLALADAVVSLPVEKGKSRVATWPVLTILPALADPLRFIFVKPEPTKECANRLRFDIQYDSGLRWITYRKILDMAAMLLGRLRPLGARDMIDVQSFMWVIARN